MTHTNVLSKIRGKVSFWSIYVLRKDGVYFADGVDQNFFPVGSAIDHAHINGEDFSVDLLSDFKVADIFLAADQGF